MQRRVLFIADQFADSARTNSERHPGGAELTDETAIEVCPWPIERARSDQLSARDLIAYDVHIIGNFERGAPELIAELTRLGRHVLFEHDVRICAHRGNYAAGLNAAHFSWHRCICPFPHLAKLFRSARGTIFLTHRQLAHYQKNPFYRPQRIAVLGSSLMNARFFDRVDKQRAQPQRRSVDTAIVYSPHPIKGYEQARRYCEQHGLEPHIIRDYTPEQVLDTFEKTRRFVYLPHGLEPAGRLLVEARMLGCEVVSNANAGVCGESWWRQPNELALQTLKDAPARFWRLVDELASGDVTIVPLRADAIELRRGSTLALQFNRWVHKAEEKLLPQRLIDAAERRRDEQCMAATVVARGSDGR